MGHNQGINVTAAAKGTELSKNAKPLERLDFSIIQQPLTGLLRNIDSDLHRRVDHAGLTTDLDEIRRLTLLLIMLRFAVNSYQATSFLLSDLDEHPSASLGSFW